MEPITRDEFLGAFRAEWEQSAAGGQEALQQLFRSDTTWTNYVLSKGGFLSRVSDKLAGRVPGLRFGTEWYTVDAVIAGGEDLFRGGLNYPSALYALIEHENGMYPEEEMWKLLHLRSPLKVLIFYDYNESEKERSAKKSSWLEEKLSHLNQMRLKVAEFHEEAPSTQYLFIIGNRDSSDEIQWRWSPSGADGLFAL